MATRDSINLALRDGIRALSSKNIKSVAQAQAATRAVLERLQYGIDIAGGFNKTLHGISQESKRQELRGLKSKIETLYKQLPPDAPQWKVPRDVWGKLYPLLVKTLTLVTGDELTLLEIDDMDTEWLSILSSSIADAPGVFGKAVGQVAAEAASAVGKTAGGIFTGLFTTWGGAVLVLVLVVVLVVVVRGRIAK